MAEENAPLSFARDIRPMFTDLDVEHMLQWMDLSNRESVLEHADAIYQTVSAGDMPPPDSGERWSPKMCATFKRWKDEGGQP